MKEKVAILVLLICAVKVFSQELKTDTFRLFYLGGQSNMDGSLATTGLRGKINLLRMKKLILVIALVIASAPIKAQKVYSVDAAYKADVKVFVVDAAYKAALLVYKVEAAYKAGDNDGKWFFTDAAYKATKKIYFVDAAYKADIKVFIVDAAYKAGWKDKSKKHVMY